MTGGTPLSTRWVPRLQSSAQQRASHPVAKTFDADCAIWYTVIVMGMTGFDRGGRRRLQAEPPSLVKGATALTANTNKLAQRGNMLAMAA